MIGVAVLAAVAIGIPVVSSALSTPDGDMIRQSADRARDTQPADVRGTASVIDGDTLDIHGVRIRLHAIDAPESSQLCDDGNGKEWRCGQRAANALADHINRRSVSCDARDTDRYGRTVAICAVGDSDLGRWMVGQGWAMAYRRYGTDYVGEENEARTAGRGIWQGEFQPPWEWRRSKR